MVARDQHLGHQPIAVALDRAAQRLQFGRHVPVRGGDIADAVSRVIWDAA